jgi:hypothetical protein
MKQGTRLIKAALHVLLPDKLLQARSVLGSTKPFAVRQCPICGFNGLFTGFGRPPRIDAQCPECGSLERHRLFWLWYQENSEKMKAPVLHFAAEKIMEQKFRKRWGAGYATADLFQQADIKLNI